MLKFLPLINNSVTTGLSFLLLAISYHQKRLIFYFFSLGCIIQWFYKYHPYHSSIQ